jgi:C4-dicarboxylate-specific signal transduction histidine kinase
MMTNAAACQRWLAAGHAQDAPFMREALTNIVNDGHRAAGIIERTRDMFRSKTAGHSVQSLDDIVKNTLRVSSPRIADAQVQVETLFDAPNPQVRGDEIQLQQVFHNFIVNALEAMSADPERERRLQISSHSETAGEVCIAFHDTGSGLQSTDIDQLCRPFYTTKAAGTGMGLAIVRTIIKSHGGRLRVRSNVAGGATFEVVLPTV